MSGVAGPSGRQWMSTARRYHGWRHVVLVLGLVAWASGPGVAQQDAHTRADTAVTLETGDQVRVWSRDTGLQGEVFRFQANRAGSLVLRKSYAAQTTRLRASEVDRLQVRRITGNHLWEGALIGGGVGLVVGGLVASIPCSSSEYRFNVSCLTWWVGRLSPFTVLPGAILGGLKGGIGHPRHQWFTVELGPEAEPLGGGSGLFLGATIGISVTLSGFD